MSRPAFLAAAFAVVATATAWAETVGDAALRAPSLAVGSLMPSPGLTFVQAGSTASSYVFPQDGVVNFFRIRQGANIGEAGNSTEVVFKILRSQSGTTYTVARQSAACTAPIEQTTTCPGSSLPVQANDILGARGIGVLGFITLDTGGAVNWSVGDPSPNTTANLNTVLGTSALTINADYTPNLPVSSGDTASVPPPTAGAPAPAAGSSDTTAPKSSFTSPKGNARLRMLKKLKGVVDPDATKVEFSLQQVVSSGKGASQAAASRCRTLRSNIKGAKRFAKPGPCAMSALKWLSGQAPRDGKWSFTLHERLAGGTYIAHARATDTAGNIGTVARVHFKVAKTVARKKR